MRILLVHNFYGSSSPSGENRVVSHRAPWAEREDKAVFLGRISAEKGLDTLVQAWLRWGAEAPKLEIIGGGPDLERLRRSAPASSGRIVFVGLKRIDEAHALLSRAKLLMLPSI
jgi:glycosyltransferase involved in cell wall biosynthesis